MRKYKLLRFGQCYINRAGDMVIGLLRGDKKHGYQFAGSSAHPTVYLGTFQLLSRIVENDGNWIEIGPEMYNVVHAFHMSGYKVKLPEKNGELPVLSEFKVVS